MKKSLIYLDHSASTPVDPVVAKKMLPYLSEKYGNPSSLHKLGEDARKAMQKARSQAADFLACKEKEIIFTSGATESNAWAVKGSLKLFAGQGSPHIIISSVEHHSISGLCEDLEKRGVEITYLPVSKQGLVNPQDVKKAIKKNTILVSIIYANNEIGVIQPIREISKVIKQENKKRDINKIIFHTDAAQAVNYLDCRVKQLGVDLLTFCAHKIYGPKGAAALYIRSDINLEPLIGPGSQEFGLRPGTENIPAIVGFGEALARVKIHRKKAKQILKLRNKLIKGVLEKIPNSRLNGSLEKRLPNNVNFSFKGAEGESVLMMLSQKGVCASTGSACASRSLEPSHVLLALGLPHEEAHCSVRFTLGVQNTAKEIDYVLKVLPDIIARLRKISGRR